MPLTLDPECQAAIDLAKRSLPDGAAAALDVKHLLPALLHGTTLGSRHPRLVLALGAPLPQREHVPEKVPLAVELRPLFQQLRDGGHLG